jgi:hypothetical protein
MLHLNATFAAQGLRVAKGGGWEQTQQKHKNKQAGSHCDATELVMAEKCTSAD